MPAKSTLAVSSWFSCE